MVTVSSNFREAQCLLSIVITANDLTQPLYHLINQIASSSRDQEHFEALIINYSNTPSSKELLDYCSQKLRNFKIISSTEGSRYSAMNIGQRFANGDVLWFIDEECELLGGKDITQVVLDLHQQHPEKLGIGGFIPLSRSIGKAAQVLFAFKKGVLNPTYAKQGTLNTLSPFNASYKRVALEQNKILFPTSSANFTSSELLVDVDLNLFHRSDKKFLELIFAAFRHGLSSTSYNICRDGQSNPLYIYSYILTFYLASFYSRLMGRKVQPASSRSFSTKVMDVIVGILQVPRTFNRLHLPSPLIHTFYLVRNTISKPFIKIYFVSLYHYETYIYPSLYWLFRKLRNRS